MNQEDILYILEQLDEGIADKNWDSVYEARETLKEYLDSDISNNED